jgi:hypothetical protein
MLLFVPLLFVAVRTFSRFDPAVAQASRAGGRRRWLAGINAACSPLARMLSGFDLPGSGRAPLLHAAAVDARLTIAAYPVVLVAAVGVAIAAVANTSADLMRGVLPVAVGIAGVLIADMPCRERTSGTLGLIYAVPSLQARFVPWKLLAVLIVSAGWLAVPFLRVAIESPVSAARLAAGVFAVASLATALGVIGGTPKTFMVVFLTFLYCVVTDAGASPPLDFAGFYGRAGTEVTLGYVAGGLALLGIAQLVHAMRVRSG